jgi:glycosyltransferase involved in cell wall biosynthesis
VESVHIPERDPADLWPKISIVTPSYNQAEFIEQTIRSILLQGYPNIEYVIMDGGSNDGTIDIIRKYEPWITSWVSAPDAGQVDALNRGFPKTTGDILNWINSDDFLLPGALFAVATLFRLDTGVDIVSGARLQRSARTGVEQIWAPWRDQWAMLAAGFPLVPQEATFFSRQLWSRVGKFDESLDYAFDGAFFSLAIAAATKIVVTETPLGVMHAYREQKSLRDDETMSSNRVQLRNLIESKLPPLRKAIVRLRFSRFWIIGDALLRCVMYGEAKRRFQIGAYDWADDVWVLKSF